MPQLLRKGAGLCAVLALVVLAGCPPVRPNVPRAAFSAGQTRGYAPLTVQFLDESRPGDAPITGWSWRFGVFGASEEQNPVFTFETPGVYDVRLTVHAANGSARHTKPEYIEVLAPVRPFVSFSASPTSGFAPLEVAFTNTAQLGTGVNAMYRWRFGDGAESDEEDPVHTYTSAGTYSVWLTVNTEHGEGSRLEAGLIQVARMVPPTAVFSASPTTGPDPLTVVFANESELGTGADVAYAWDFGDGETSSQAAPGHTYARLGRYSVSLTVTTEHGESTATRPDFIHVTKDYLSLGGEAVDRARALVETADGGLVLAGDTQSLGAGGRDAYLVKVGHSGNPEWARTFGGPGDDFANGLARLNDGGFVLAGAQEGATGRTSALVVRTDSQGNRVWSRTLATAPPAVEMVDDVATAVVVAADGGIVVAGTSETGLGEVRAFLLKLDAEGNLLWTEQLGEARRPNAVVQTAQGGFALAGTAGDADNFDAFLLLTDSRGREVGFTTYGGGRSESAHDLFQDAQGGFVLAGGTTSFGGDSDVYVVRTNAGGEELQALVWGGEGDDRAHAVAGLEDGGFAVAGFTDSAGAGLRDAYLARLDATGALVWERTAGGPASDEAHALVAAQGGGFAMAGQTASFGSGSLDFFVVRTDDAGEVVPFP